MSSATLPAANDCSMNETPHLPDELKILIVDTVRDRGDRSTLCALARTGTLLHDRAIAGLYSIASINHEETLSAEEIEADAAHPLRSHPYLKWSDDMDGIEKRRRFLRDGLTFLTETYPASLGTSRNGTTRFKNNHCKCCYTGPEGSADTTSPSLLRNQLSTKLPHTRLCQIEYRAARAPGQSGSGFFNEIMCMLTEHIHADTYFSIVDPLSDRWRSTFVFAAPTRFDVSPEDGSNPLSHRLLHRLHSGEVVVGFLPAEPCGDQDEESLPAHIADKEADVLQAARSLYRHVAGIAAEADAVSRSTTFLFAEDPCTHKGNTEKSDIRNQAAHRLVMTNHVGLAGNVRIEDLEGHPEVARVLHGGKDSSFASLESMP